MRLLTYLRNDRACYGAFISGRVHEVHYDLGVDHRNYLESAAIVRQIENRIQDRSAALEELDLLPPIANPTKIICVGLNYTGHVEETGRTVVGYPTIFTRFSDTQMGHGAPIVLPHVSEQVDYEGEMAIVIGKPGRNIAVDTAMSHIGAYGCYNDVSVRDWQRHGTQWTPGKNFPSTGAFGPWIVTADEVGDPTALTIETRLNGTVMQNASTAQLIYPLAHLVSYISTFTPLGPGDVICTGTPGGVGFARKPPVFLRPGDVVEVEIERIGLLRNFVNREGR